MSNDQAIGISVHAHGQQHLPRDRTTVYTILKGLPGEMPIDARSLQPAAAAYFWYWYWWLLAYSYRPILQLEQCIAHFVGLLCGMPVQMQDCVPFEGSRLEGKERNFLQTFLWTKVRMFLLLRSTCMMYLFLR